MPSRLTERMKMFIFLLHHREGRSMREVSRITGHAQVTVKRILLDPPVTPEDQAQIDYFLSLSDAERAELRASFPSVEENEAQLDATLADLWLELGPREAGLMYPKMVDS